MCSFYDCISVYDALDKIKNLGLSRRTPEYYRYDSRLANLILTTSSDAVSCHIGGNAGEFVRTLGPYSHVITDFRGIFGG